MAIASCSVHIISRGKGRSSVAAAAYRSGQTLQNDYEGLSYSYPRKKGIVHEAILAPAQAPDWAQDRQQLWNMVEHTERRKDARLAWEVMVALPRELSSDQNIEVAREYALTFVRQGMIVDVSVHDSGDGNPHAHLLLTTRPLDGDVFSKKKNRDWDSTDRLIDWRKEYEAITNRYLERYGHEQRIDVRSYEEQGLDRIPTIHLGHYAHRLEQNGKETDRGNINRDIQKANNEIDGINMEIELLKNELEQEMGYIKSVDAKIKHYNKVNEELQRTAEVLAHRLTEKGAQYLAGQQRSVEAAIQRLKKSSTEEDSALPPPAGGLEQQRKTGFDELYEVPAGQSRYQPEPSGLQEKSAPPQQQTSEKEEHTHHSPVDEPGRHRKSGFDELYEFPDRQPRQQERAAPPAHPPPLRRHREERHLAQPHKSAEESRERHRASKEQTKRPQLDEYDALYGTPEERYIRQAKEQETPSHHVTTRRKERQAEYNDLYREPGGGNTRYRSHQPDPDDPDPKK